MRREQLARLLISEIGVGVQVRPLLRFACGPHTLMHVSDLFARVVLSEACAVRLAIRVGSPDRRKEKGGDQCNQWVLAHSHVA